MISRTRTFKDLLWFLSLLGLVAALFRLWFGLGATTNLSDMVPWGLWKILNMVAGVALSTSGFTVGFLVYVLRLEKFRPFMKPAILVAFLGYGCSCLALLFDIGLPQRFWHPIFMWNINSFLFEVFWCVLLYFTVTAIELAPSIFEILKADKINKILHRIAFVVVVIGISLSSLHHSSLGSLFLVTPQRLHALWYSPWLPLFFILSAMGGGLLFMIFVKILWSWWYDRESVFGTTSMRNIPLLKKANGLEKLTDHAEGRELSIIRQLASIAAGIMIFYLALKITDLFIHGAWGVLLAGTWESWLYLFELLIASVIPVCLIIIPQTRRSPGFLGVASFSGAFGLAMNRMDVGIFGYFRDAGIVYFPSLIEWAVCFGVVAAAGLMLFFVAENLPIFSNNPPAVQSKTGIFRQAFGTLRQIWHTVYMDSLHRVSLIAVVTITIAFVLMYPPFFDDHAVNQPVKASLGIDKERAVLKIDGDHQGVDVIFAHSEHQKRLGDSLSCAVCHHVSLPNDKSTPCSECHRFMNAPANIFKHDAHKIYIAEKEGLAGFFPGNNSCTKCHPANSPKTTANAINCLECHKQDMYLNAEVEKDANLLIANSFREAMHNTCIDCHSKEMVKTGSKMLDNCGTCHQTLKACDLPKQEIVQTNKTQLERQSQN